METIEIKDKDKDHPKHRVLKLKAPECLQATDLSALVALVGEEVVFNYTQRQLATSFRQFVRPKMGILDDNEDFEHPDEYFTEGEFAESLATWIPKLREVKTPAEAITSLLEKYDPEEAAAILAAAAAAQGVTTDEE